MYDNEKIIKCIDTKNTKLRMVNSDKRACHVQACDVFNMERVVSTRVYVFERACFNVSKTWKPEHAHLKHVTRLPRRVRRVWHVSTLVVRINSIKFK
jgi:hypothetical protein